MKKLTIIFAALIMASTTLMAETVNYIDANGVNQTADATEVTNTIDTLHAGWYVVTNTDVQTGSLVCNGAVNLILADSAKLTATGGDRQAGIHVSGTGNSLTIYAQSTDTTTMGKLIAYGGVDAAGIGSERECSESAITINGGMVTAKGGNRSAGIGGGYKACNSTITINDGNITAIGTTGGAGIGEGHSGADFTITINGGKITAIGANGGAGIGDGHSGTCSTITINGGTVAASCGGMGAAIGGGDGSTDSNITINGGTVTAIGNEPYSGIGHGGNGTIQFVRVATSLIIKAGTTAPTNLIATTRTSTTDIQNDLDGKQYVFIELNPLPGIKAAAIDSVNAAISETDPDYIKNIAANAVAAINAAKTAEEAETLKTQTLAAIAIAKAAYTRGKEEGIVQGRAEAQSELPTDPEGTAGTAVVITKGTKSLSLINPDSITYKTEN